MTDKSDVMRGPTNGGNCPVCGVRLPSDYQGECPDCGDVGASFDRIDTALSQTDEQPDTQGTDGLAGELANEVDDFQKPDLSAMHRSELEAEVVHMAKLIERFRQSIANIVRETEDEGDRVYFGSTNDADELAELDKRLTDCGNELFMPWSNGDDLYADIRDLRSDVARLTRENTALRTDRKAVLEEAAHKAHCAIVDLSFSKEWKDLAPADFSIAACEAILAMKESTQ